MGICVPKAAGDPPEADLEADEPLSPPSKRRSELPRMAPGNHGGFADEEPRAPDPSPKKGAGASEDVSAPKPPPRRKASLQMDAADMSKMLTQITPGTPMSPTGRRSTVPCRLPGLLPHAVVPANSEPSPPPPQIATCVSNLWWSVPLAPP